LNFQAFINGRKVFVNEQFFATYSLVCGLYKNAGIRTLEKLLY